MDVAQDFMTIEERKIYNKWRLRILFSIILGYGSYYLCRQNFSIIMPAYMEEFGYTKTQLGLIFTLASVVYGFGKFFNGYLSDRSNAKYFMPLGLLASAIITFCLGFSYSLFFLGTFWVLNNWFQSMGWPPVARMLTHWFAPKELGTKWALGAASHQMGGAIALIMSAYIVEYMGWRYAFFIPSIFSILVAIFLLFTLKESPKELGFPPVEAYKGEEKKYIEHEKEDNMSTKEIFKTVFVNKFMWYIASANMFVYIVGIGIIFWGPLFLKEFRNIPITEAGFQVAAYEISGLLGGFAAGWLSDKVFGGVRGKVGAVFMLLLAVALIIFWKLPENQEYLSPILLILVGFFVCGPRILVGVAAADFTSKKAVGTANGLVGIMGYVGSGLSGVCIGFLIDNFGWYAAFYFFIASAFCGAILFWLTAIHHKK